MLKFCLSVPLKIQPAIIKRIPDVKPLLQFRSYSKPWKSFIGSCEFITSYQVRHTQQLFFYKNARDPSEEKYTCFVDDDNGTFTHQQDFASTLSTITKQHTDLTVIGCSRGLLCLHGRSISCGGEKFVLWNPCITKSVVIAAPFADDTLEIAYGFGVCPVTNDPTIVRIEYPDPDKPYSHIHKPWHVEVFTLSTGVWNALPCSNIPLKLNTGRFEPCHVDFKSIESSQVVTNRFIYWLASKVSSDDRGSWEEYLILSFDLIAKEFRVVDMPDSLEHSLELEWEQQIISISKLKESLVLFVCRGDVCDVHKMEPDGYLTKLFIINTPDNYLNRQMLGFRKNGEIVMETLKEDKEFDALEIYDPCSERISDLGIYGKYGTFFMSSYKETMLLLDQSDSCVYPAINDD